MTKTALITGSSRGIGEAIAYSLASKSYNVVINYISSEEKAKEVQDYIVKTYNVKAICIKADVSKEEEVKQMMETIYNTFGSIDVVVNNAGIAYGTGTVVYFAIKAWLAGTKYITDPLVEIRKK